MKRLQFERKKLDNEVNESAAGEPDSRTYNYVLNNFVFPSMANIIYFLEQVAEHKELRKVFDGDIQELFGLVETKDARSKRQRGRAIQRLFDAMVAANDGINGNDDFRLHVVEEMARTCSNRIDNIAVRRMDNVDAGHLIGVDGHRARAWAKILAQSYKLKEETPKRPILF